MDAASCVEIAIAETISTVLNSFFAKFASVPLRLVSEIIKCFIIKDISANKTSKLLVDEI